MKRFHAGCADSLAVPTLIGLVIVARASAGMSAPPKSAAPSKRIAPVTPAAVTVAAKPAAPVILPPIKSLAPPPMWAVAYSPDGKQIAVGTYRRLLVFDAATGAKTGDYLVSSDAIRSLAYSGDGHQIALATGIAAKSGTILLVDSATGKVTSNIRDHDDTIDALAWEGNDLVSAANDETVGINDAATGKTVATLTEHIGRCLAVAVPTKTDPANGGDIFATGGADKSVKIWDAKLRRVVVNFDQSTGAVWCLAPTRNPGQFVAGSDDGKIRLFQVRADGTRRANAPADEPDPRTGYLAREQVAHRGAVYTVAAAPDGNHIVSGGADGKVIVWSGNIDHQRDLTDAKRDIWSVAISPDSKQVAASSLDGRTRIYDLDKGTLIFTLDGNGVVAPPAPPTPLVPGTKRVYGPPSPSPVGAKVILGPPSPSAAMQKVRK